MTSPNASRFRLPAAGSTLESLAFAFDAAVAAVGPPLVGAVLVDDKGFAVIRVVILDGRALAFSLSFWVTRVVRVIRRVYVDHRLATLQYKLVLCLQECLRTLWNELEPVVDVEKDDDGRGGESWSGRRRRCC